MTGLNIDLLHKSAVADGFLDYNPIFASNSSGIDKDISGKVEGRRRTGAALKAQRRSPEESLPVRRLLTSNRKSACRVERSEAESKHQRLSFPDVLATKILTSEFCMRLRHTNMDETHLESMSFDGVGGLHVQMA
jgi:hypothetical protein